MARRGIIKVMHQSAFLPYHHGTHVSKRLLERSALQLSFGAANLERRNVRSCKRTEE